MNEKINHIAEKILAGDVIDRESAEYLFSLDKSMLWDIMYWANKIRQQFFGNRIKICSIIPARLGGCSQDCSFCAQSSKSNTAFKNVKSLDDDEILAAAADAKKNGVPTFGIVYSGKTINEKELVRLAKLIAKIKQQVGIEICAGVGIIDYQQAVRLKNAGLDRYNHNLETSQRHFKNIVSTHDYQSRAETIKATQKAGLGICAGGIFGIGETNSDRIDMAFELRRLRADMVPMNFLHPIKGTPLADMPKLKPLEILRIIALYRFILPRAEIKAAGGRVLNLRDLQSWIFYAGATAILSGNYLTTAGRSVKEDIQMIEDLGLQANIK